MGDNYVLCVRSRDRSSGNPNSYSVIIPQIKKGLYKATFNLLENDAGGPYELRIRGGVVQYGATMSDGYAVACQFHAYESNGVLYMQDIPQTLDVMIMDIVGGAMAAGIQEHTFKIHLEKQ